MNDYFRSPTVRVAINGETKMAKSIVKTGKTITPADEDIQTLDVNALVAKSVKAPTYSELDNTAADKAIRQIIASGGKLKVLVQETLVGILLHYVNHGDYTKLATLRDAVRKSLGASQAAAMTRFVESFSTIHENKEGKFAKRPGTKNVAFGMGKEDLDTSKIHDFVNGKGEKVGMFWAFDTLPAKPKGVDFLADVLAPLVNRAMRLNAETKLGEEGTGRKVVTNLRGEDGKKVEKVVALPHKNIDDSMVKALLDFATSHGLVLNEDGKLVVAEQPKTTVIRAEKKPTKVINQETAH